MNQQVCLLYSQSQTLAEMQLLEWVIFLIFKHFVANRMDGKIRGYFAGKCASHSVRYRDDHSIVILLKCQQIGWRRGVFVCCPRVCRAEVNNQEIIFVPLANTTDISTGKQGDINRSGIGHKWVQINLLNLMSNLARDYKHIRQIEAMEKVGRFRVEASIYGYPFFLLISSRHDVLGLAAYQISRNHPITYIADQ